MAFQPAKTIMPSTIDQIAVSSGYYTGGDIIVAGDNNLVAENIKSGVSIFGVEGIAEKGKEYSENEDAIITKNINGNYINNEVTAIRNYAFISCYQLSTVSFPMCMSIGRYAFYQCSKITTISFPACTFIDYNAFAFCNSLTTIFFPACITIWNDAFMYCSNLITASFPACTDIGNNAFYACQKLTTISFPACTTIDEDAFRNCSNLLSVNFPVCKNISSLAFARCSKLSIASFSTCISIDRKVFNECYKLSSFVLGASSICVLKDSNAFSSTPYTGYSSYFSGIPRIYVPASLIASYQNATNWVYFSSYFSSIESLNE